jgi:predicted kinase
MLVPQERYALRAIANLADADFELHYLTLPEDERRQRADARWRASPEDIFEMNLEDHERFPCPVLTAHARRAPRLLPSSASDTVRELARLGL